MLDENLIATLEQSLRQTRNAQNRLMARLREAENEVELLRQEITALENSASQTESAIDSLLVTMRSGSRGLNMSRSIKIDDEYEIRPESRDAYRDNGRADNGDIGGRRYGGSVSYINQHRGVPSIHHNSEPISHRFSDRTITQACTLLLRESGKPLHVNELYNLLIAGGMNFKGNNPTISIAVSLNRNRRFRKVDPGTFDLVMREAERAAS
ncbi:MAG: hypothetical protein KA746_14905 [Pyrinomonadaceae bacterium]|jgi:hypothetical protein|nr:hypothetical protein [Pyrinomonadaceae bacterium]